MSRSARESSTCDVPGCGMHAPPPHALLKVTPGIVVGPVSVPVPAVQLTANRQKFSDVVVMLSKKLRDPAGGRILPSRSAGSRLWWLVLVDAQSCRALAPISILSRSKAHTLLPAKLRPFLNML